MSVVKCAGCSKLYNYEENDGLCPKCGAYNKNNRSITSAKYVDNSINYTQNMYMDEKKQNHLHTEHSGVFGAGLDPECMEDDGTTVTNIPSYTAPQTTYRPYNNTAYNRAAPQFNQNGKQKKNSSNAGTVIAVIVFIIIIILKMLTN